MIHRYPKIYNLGHRAIQGLFLDEVMIEEKVDGSQFSFCKDKDGNLHCRSKGKEIEPDAPEKMFRRAVETVREIEPLMIPGIIYRGEYLEKPKHNTLAYDRVPSKHIVLFDLEIGEQGFANTVDKQGAARVMGLECVPLLARGKFESWESLKELLNTESFLGGQKIEGMVIKNYNRICPMTGEILMGKHVSEAFKEIHQGDWRERNPGKKDILEQIIEALKTPARWSKAIQHLRERGELEESPRDIGKLIKEVQTDVEAECREEIADRLMRWALSNILRGVIKGFPEWYKEQLAQSAFK